MHQPDNTGSALGRHPRRVSGRPPSTAIAAPVVRVRWLAAAKAAPAWRTDRIDHAPEDAPIRRDHIVDPKRGEMILHARGENAERHDGARTASEYNGPTTDAKDRRCCAAEVLILSGDRKAPHLEDET